MDSLDGDVGEPDIWRNPKQAMVENRERGRAMQI